ncbi:hypothetical protein H9W90_03590 [Polaribacter pectinis]|uniref:Uncharacterized protein n=1 Tax=Polaribacter pectinis TaxID=2738844 RepID=A0A7G9LC67_9FLAO|nr:hypothetical protein [Polaribacter pectinis]QNM86216.1 hypothetical protein H9W90_03590 [Polaribacter pectinis]
MVDNINSRIDYLYIDFRDVNFKIGEKVLFDYRITENASRVNNFID